MNAGTTDSSTHEADASADYGDIDDNRAFETLIEYETDLVGMIADARYKAAKQSWLRRRKAQDGAPPTNTDYRTFVAAQLDADNIQRLRQEANGMLADYSNTVLQEEAPGIREDALRNHALAQANDTLNSVTRQNAWWRQLILAILGAFAYSLFLAAIVLVLRLVGVDILTVLANATR